MNMKYMTYAAAVEAIAGSFFDENNKYLPEIGKGRVGSQRKSARRNGTRCS